MPASSWILSFTIDSIHIFISTSSTEIKNIFFQIYNYNGYFLKTEIKKKELKHDLSTIV